MATIKLGFTRLPTSNKIVQARLYVSKMSNNAAFAAPEPTLASIAAAATTLENAYNAAKDGSKTKIAEAKAATTALVQLINLLATYVQYQSKGDATLIESTGFAVRQLNNKANDMPMVTNVIAAIGINDGEVQLKWKRIPTCKIYLIEQSPDGNTNWTYTSESPTRTTTLKGLPTATKIWLRIAAFGAKGKGPWSDPVKVLVS
jgi:hypothetical protein